MIKDKTFLEIANLIAKESTCVSKQVGAVIVKDGRIISIGYNGVPSGCKHCTEVAKENGWIEREPRTLEYVLVNRAAHSEWSEQNEIHAEENAICYAAREAIRVAGATMYVTMSPCPKCSKMIVSAGIRRVVVGSVYDRATPNWKEWLEDRGVKVDVFA